MADTQGSGPCAGNGVEVRLLSGAPLLFLQKTPFQGHGSPHLASTLSPAEAIQLDEFFGFDPVVSTVAFEEAVGGDEVDVERAFVVSEESFNGEVSGFKAFANGFFEGGHFVEADEVAFGAGAEEVGDVAGNAFVFDVREHAEERSHAGAARDPPCCAPVGETAGEFVPDWCELIGQIGREANVEKTAAPLRRF